MGTHPIFESDFDCLTDCLNMWGDGPDPALMTEEEREKFYLEDETLKERIDNFYSNAALFKTLQSIELKSKFSRFWNSGFNYTPILLIGVSWYAIQSERFSAMNVVNPTARMYPRN